MTLPYSLSKTHLSPTVNNQKTAIFGLTVPGEQRHLNKVCVRQLGSASTRVVSECLCITWTHLLALVLTEQSLLFLTIHGPSAAAACLGGERPGRTAHPLPAVHSPSENRTG